MTPASMPRPLWRRLLTPLGVLLAINAAVFVAYTLPRSLQEKSVVARDETLRSEVARERASVGELRRRAETLKANGRDTERFHREILGDRGPDLVATIEEVEKAAAELGLKSQNRTWEHTNVSELPAVKTVIRMPLRGSYQQLVAFLDRIERSKRFLVIEQVGLRESQDGQAELTVAVGTYFRASADGDRKG